MIKQFYKFLNDRNVKKRELYKGYARFRTDLNQGDSLISFFQQFLDLSKGIAIATFLKVWIPSMSIAFAGGIIAIWFIFKVITKLLIASLYKKSGAWQVDSEYVAKSEHINPWQVEVTKTMENIAEKIGAKSEFEKL